MELREHPKGSRDRNTNHLRMSNVLTARLDGDNRCRCTPMRERWRSGGVTNPKRPSVERAVTCSAAPWSSFSKALHRRSTAQTLEHKPALRPGALVLLQTSPSALTWKLYVQTPPAPFAAAPPAPPSLCTSKKASVRVSDLRPPPQTHPLRALNASTSNRLQKRGSTTLKELFGSSSRAQQACLCMYL